MKIREYLIKQDENGAFHLFHIGDEVVRCENCKYYVTNYAVPHCGRTLIGMKKSDYCSYGERR